MSITAQVNCFIRCKFIKQNHVKIWEDSSMIHTGTEPHILLGRWHHALVVEDPSTFRRLDWTNLSDAGKEKLSSHKSPSKARLLQLLLLPLLPGKKRTALSRERTGRAPSLRPRGAPGGFGDAPSTIDNHSTPLFILQIKATEGLFG